MARLQMSLVDNSKRFFVEALQRAVAAEKDPHDWQFAILSLVQSIELVLKELLRQQHPLLLFQNVDSPKHTVTLESAVHRLKSAANIVFDEPDLKTIRTAADFRNQIVHYEYAFETNELKLVFAKLFGFLQEFYLQRLDISIDSFVPKPLWMEGVSISEYGSELYSRAVKLFEEKGYSDEYIITCPKCGWDALSAWDDVNACYVCGHSAFLTTCKQCSKVVLKDEAVELGSALYCSSCADYLDDDYWYESRHGK